MEKKAKEKRGITLIVLIITVILMLILAGVAVSTITTEGIPFGKMENIAGKYNNTVEERQKAIDKIIEEMNEDYIGEGSGGESSGGNNTPPAGGDENNNTQDGAYDGSAYTGVRALPSKKYYDLYTYGTSNTDYTRGKIGDVTAELKPVSSSKTAWNDDYAHFVYSNAPGFIRGGCCSSYSGPGVFSFSYNSGSSNGSASFRVVLSVF